jgi:hypothetical protein
MMLLLDEEKRLLSLLMGQRGQYFLLKEDKQFIQFQLPSLLLQMRVEA